MPNCIYCEEEFSYIGNFKRKICYKPECKKRQLSEISKRYYKKQIMEFKRLDI